MNHLTREQLDAGLAHIEGSPKDDGTLDLIVRRPQPLDREVVEHAELSLDEGLVGDSWNRRFSKRTDDGSPHPDMQLNIMNSRVIGLIAGSAERHALAGDQLFVDLDLSADNLPPGTRLAIGSVVIEITDQPHNGCAKFTERFGIDAARWVNGDDGNRLKLRGINAKVVVPGSLSRGNRVTKLSVQR